MASCDDDQFQIVLTKSDYDKLLAVQDALTQTQNKNQQLKQQYGDLQNILKDHKKSLELKKQELNFFRAMVQTFMDECTKKKKQEVIEESMYESLVDNNMKGLSSIQLLEFRNQLLNNYQHITDSLELIRCKVTSEDDEYQLLRKLKEARKSTTQSQLVQHHAEDIVRLTKAVGELMNQKHSLQKELTLLKKKNKELSLKLEEYQVKGNITSTGQEKPHFIKLMIDEYWRELEVNLAMIQGTTRTEIDTVLRNEMEGIVTYVNTMIKNHLSRK